MMRIGQNTSKTAEKSAVISLADDGTKIKGGGVTVKDQVITITNPGDYTFSGSLSDGRIVIDVSKGTVNVTLNGVDITSSERDVIFSKDSAADSKCGASWCEIETGNESDLRNI